MVEYLCMCNTQGHAGWNKHNTQTTITTATLFVVYVYVVCCDEFKSADNTMDEQHLSSLAAGLLQ